MINENLDIFLADFGVVCTAGTVTAKGILDMPTQFVSGGMMLSDEYKLTAKASDFGNLAYGSLITVDGILYSVKSVSKIDNGAFCEIAIQRDQTEPTITTDLNLDGGSATSTDYPSDIFDGGTA